MVKALVVALPILFLATASLIAYGKRRARVETATRRARLTAARIPIGPARYHASDVRDVPDPVRRYFSLVLREGQPLISAGHLTQTGQIRLKPTPDGWRAFVASQSFTCVPPGFDWAARVRMAPGADVYVHDSYVVGRGALHATMLSLLTVARATEGPELTRGQLLRFLAEAVWFPTALLPSPRLHWEPIDDSAARATLKDGAAQVGVDVRFRADGLIESIFAVRHRDIGGTLEPTPWRGRFRDYAWRNSVQIPLEGEVEWELASGPFRYWRGRIDDIRYELAE
jgi:hypothetical protein